jgi:uncharacterized protein (TIGR02284 family)
MFSGDVMDGAGQSLFPSLRRWSPGHATCPLDGMHGPCPAAIHERNPTMSNDDIVDTLNDLIETCKDGEFGFNACAKHTSSSELRSLFLQRAAECKTAAAELQPYVVQYGGKPDQGGSASGALHRGWVAVRGSLVGFSDQAMLDECERGEDAALARYRKALKQELPEPLLALVQRQELGVQRNHDQIKALRDRTKANL